jgi:hypothetical protein
MRFVHSHSYILLCDIQLLFTNCYCYIHLSHTVLPSCLRARELRAKLLKRTLKKKSSGGVSNRIQKIKRDSCCQPCRSHDGNLKNELPKINAHTNTDTYTHKHKNHSQTHEHADTHRHNQHDHLPYTHRLKSGNMLFKVGVGAEHSIAFAAYLIRITIILRISACSMNSFD